MIIVRIILGQVYTFEIKTNSYHKKLNQFQKKVLEEENDYKKQTS